MTIRTSTYDRATHPAFTKRGAVQPRNYDASAHTAEDTHMAYTRAAQRAGKTVGDILSECIAARLRLKLSSS